mmetsp:Transcript_9262/g.10240  ORF Transcript_9262/g.10240 Transcript_9262/m.10240 type:complete len:184 (+) Transcript_9262:65-616(+)
MATQSTIEEIKATFKAYKDFPKQGVTFFDIHPLMRTPDERKKMLDILINRYKGKIDAVVGLESRGYYFGIPLAFALAVPFVPLRKPGKLPGKLQSVSYGTQYSKDTICVQEEALPKGTKVAVIDDLLATGGTAAAALELMKKVGAEVVELHCCVELVDLGGRKKLGDTKFHSLLILEFSKTLY